MSSRSKFFLVFLIAGNFVAFVAHSFWIQSFGQVVASHGEWIGGIKYRVHLRERPVSDFDIFLLDRIFRARSSEYEYWAELRLSNRLTAISERFHSDSTVFEEPRIKTADAKGANVALDSRPSRKYVHFFPWISAP